MKVLMVIHSLAGGGAQKQFLILAEGLTKAGINVAIRAYRGQLPEEFAQLRKQGADVEILKRSFRGDLRFFFHLRSEMVRKGTDIVLSFLDMPNFYCEMARGWRRKPRLVVSIRNGLPPEGPDLSLRMLQHVHRMADRVVFNARHQFREYGQRFPWIQHRGEVILNGYPISDNRPICSAKERGRDVVFLALSHIQPGKDAESLVRALALYREKWGSPPQVHWAGGVVDSPAAKEYARQMRALVDELQLQSCWRWLGDRRDGAALLRDADALIHPSKFEGMSNSICEALIAGRPVLGANHCDADWLLGASGAGLIFEPSNSQSIAETMRAFVHLSESGKHAMGEKAREFAERNLRAERMTDEYLKLFRSLLGGLAISSLPFSPEPESCLG